MNELSRQTGRGGRQSGISLKRTRCAKALGHGEEQRLPEVARDGVGPSNQEGLWALRTTSSFE